MSQVYVSQHLLVRHKQTLLRRTERIMVINDTFHRKTTPVELGNHAVDHRAHTAVCGSASR